MLIAALVLSACAEIGTPDLGEGVSGPATTAPPDDSGDAPVQEVVSASISPVFAPSRSDDYTPVVLASTGTGTVTIDADGTIFSLGPLFGGAEIERSVDDYFGGIVAQLEGSVVQWLPANTNQAQLVSRANGSLLDAGFLDASLALQVFISVPGGIDRIKLVDGEREPFTRLADGETLIDFSSSNGIQAMAIRDDDCGALRFLNASGQQVDLRGPETRDCPVKRRPRFGAVAMSPDGGAVAYTEITYRGDGLPASTQLIAIEISTSALLLSQQVGGPGEQIESLSYDGRRFSFLRTGESGRELAMLALSEGGETIVEGLDEVRFVSFARLPLALAVIEPELVPESELEPPTEGEGGG